MNTAAPRIVLDTNILIASIGRRSPFRWIFDGVINGTIILTLSTEILLEYEEVLGRKTTAEIAQNLTAFLTVSPFCETVEPYFNFGLIDADPADNKFVDCAIAAAADHLVSNDRHFNVLRTVDFPKVNILTLAEFTVKYGPSDSSQ
jgi:putative PIN family toxin of toxin-antitoxin system